MKERTGGEPDVIGQNEDTGIYLVIAQQKLQGRRTICYDRKGEELRKKKGVYQKVMIDLADAMGIEI